MKRILIAPDSFKGSITAKEAAHAIAQGLRDHADADILPIEFPIADGGEGTLDILTSQENRITSLSFDAYGMPISAEWGYIDDVAVIEAARAVGPANIPLECRRPENSTSRGVGALISSALSHGAKKLLLTVGGTACNDGGAGMLCELGARFYDHATELFDIRASDLCRITKIDICGIDKRLYDLDIDIACDVTNPLLGCDGATYTYGKQKGASDAALASLEYGIKNFAEKLAPNAVDTPGVGAGGGIPFPLVALFGAHIDSGIATVLKATRFESELQLADLVITGEGMVDAQSARGKAVGGIAVLASQLDIPVIVIAGSVGPGAETMFSLGVFDIYAIRDISPTTEYAIEHAAFLLRQFAAAFDFDVYLNL